MQKYRKVLVFIYSVIIFLGVIVFSACIASEFKKSKGKDVRLDGRLCYVPKSHAFVLGIIACIVLSAAQMIGHAVVAILFVTQQEKIIAREQKIPLTMLGLSWISFGFAITLLGGATSMNFMQAYGEGWLDGECYLVKDGVYTGAGVLAVATVMLLLGSIMASIRLSTQQSETERKLFAVMEK
ncbi:hypothetical protein ACHQM5_028908 [Ranunculus cassubicifolius]